MTFTRQEVENDLAALEADGLIEHTTVEQAVEQGMATQVGSSFEYSPSLSHKGDSDMETLVVVRKRTQCNEAILRRALALREQGIGYQEINRVLGIQSAWSWLNGKTKTAQRLLDLIQKTE